MQWGAKGQRDNSFSLSLLHFARCGSERGSAQHGLSPTHVSKGAAVVENLQNVPHRDNNDTAQGRAVGWREMTTDKSQRDDQDSQKDTMAPRRLQSTQLPNHPSLQAG